MAQITNPTVRPVLLPSGHVIPAATGNWTEDGFRCTAPGTLSTSNDVLRGDNAFVMRGPVAAGMMAVAYDPDPETTSETPHDWIAAQAKEAIAAIAEGKADEEAEAKERAASAAEKVLVEAAAAAEQAAAEPVPVIEADEPAAVEPAAEVLAEEVPVRARR